MRSTRLAAVAAAAVLALTTAAEAPAQDCGATYTIRQGDTLGAIATRCGSTVEALVQANPRITDPARLSVGWELVVPTTDGAAGKEAAAAIAEQWARERDARAAAVLAGGRYTVEKGDSMASIATALGVPLAALIAANDAVDPFALRPGQELVLPSAGPAADDAGEAPEAGASADPEETPAPAADDADAAAGDRRYTVEKGDSMAGIAAAHGLPLAALFAANEGVDPKAIQPGQELVLPAAGPTAEDAGEAPQAGASAGPEETAVPAADDAAADDADADAAAGDRRYTVEKGDSMAGIAAAHGLPLAALLDANEGVDPRAIRPGQELVLPGVGPTAEDAGDAPEAGASAGPEGTAAPAGENGDAGVAEARAVAVETPAKAIPERLSLEGRVQKGAECPVLRTPDGRIYSLVSQAYSFTPGQYVAIKGEPVKMSFCTQGQTVRVTTMSERPAPQGG